MNGAIVLLTVNAVVAGMFALCYGLIAIINKGQRPVLPFGISYLIGMITPLSELALHWSSYTVPFMIGSYASLLGGFLAMAVALARFEREPPEWHAIAIIALFGFAARAVIWGEPRDNLSYELAYQMPFIAALLLCALTALRQARGRGPMYMLSTLFGIIALNFLMKPFVAAAVGSGRSAREYVASAYALYSQASTGILLIAAGLVVLLVVIQATIHDYMQASETDHLSGLLNRRGFDRLAQDVLAQCPRDAVTAIMIDLDHFKQINDVHGHDVGDEVIREFAAMLRSVVPASALCARMGGEEFVVLLHRGALTAGHSIAETIRAQTAILADDSIPAFTLSAGVAQRLTGESLSELMRRADQASYRAKQAGRNRVAVDPICDDRSDRANVFAFQSSLRQ